MNINNIGASDGIDRFAELGKAGRNSGQPQELFGTILGSKIKEAAGESANSAAHSVDTRNVDTERELGLLSLLKNLDGDTRKMAAMNINQKGMDADEAVYQAKVTTGRFPAVS